ncbi:cell division protein FtsN [Xenorhabdus mauleonii]|uniref:Cell division protein FtsN n=1 Tax=Xenorhabdus mauleonii TaxID=351675 RepID=A0A1I3TZU0_9GAMM|nr:cell division protein FtsN [Xenorhabdus mauleonii]PHM39537.1 cell division protein FtsN [Xenorhabdus mauleonii]SFJ76003.1 cell division protein FtsN [Xenorhabdus mauleonii]
MAQRDYVSRGRTNPRKKSTGKKNNQSQGLPKTTLAVAVALVIMFIGGLFFIVHNKKESVQTAPTPAHNPKNHGLPPKPEERWSYIKELENRPVNESSIQDPSAIPNQPSVRSPQLTPEQKQLLEQMQSDMRQPPVSLKEVPYNGAPAAPPHVLTAPPAQVPEYESRQARQAAPEQKTAANDARLMLQCGSFRTMEQAESVRASLAFAGIESQITTKDNWNRVVLGPYNNKNSAEKMRGRVADAGVSGCILRPVGG